MEIAFSKKITGLDNLKDFLGDERKLDVTDQYLNGYFLFRPYHLAKLAACSVDSIEEKLKKNGLDVTRSGVNSLWVSEANPFALDLKVMAPPRNPCFPECSTYPNVEIYDERSIESKITKVGEEEQIKKGFLITTRIKRDVYKVNPTVDVFGTVKYEKLAVIDSKQILEILTALGYNSCVTPTSEQIIKAFEKAMGEAQKRKISHTSGSRSSEEDDCLVEAAVAFVLGGILL